MTTTDRPTPTCPSWCERCYTDVAGVTEHNRFVDLPGVGSWAQAFAEQRPGQPCDHPVSTTDSDDGVGLGAAEVRTLAQAVRGTEPSQGQASPSTGGRAPGLRGFVRHQKKLQLDAPLPRGVSQAMARSR